MLAFIAIKPHTGLPNHIHASNLQFWCLQQIYQQNLQRIVMAAVRHKTETIDADNQRSMRSISIEKPHFFQQNRKKYKFSHAHLQSLHSIDTKRSSINLYQNARLKGPNRRRQLSIPVNEPKHILTERPEIYEVTSKKFSENRVGLPLRQERMATIGDERLEDKEKRIKDCIQVMCGVLKEIRNQKSTKKITKTKIIEEFNNDREATQRPKEEPPESKFESYIKNITKLKESNKAIIIKRGKSKSIINNQNIPSTNVNSKSFLIKQKLNPSIQMLEPPMIKRNIEQPTSRPKKSAEPVKLQQISCSSIEKGNQSSFVSEHSRQSFVRNILEDVGRACEEKEEGRKIVKFKNSKQLKQLFPVDFF